MWRLLSAKQSIYHNNGVGKPELKYITADGREAVFDGDTLQPVTDPRYMGTYNYSPLYELPDNAGAIDYLKWANSGLGHFLCDMVPYYMVYCSNTRECYERKCFKILVESVAFSMAEDI